MPNGIKYFTYTNRYDMIIIGSHLIRGNIMEKRKKKDYIKEEDNFKNWLIEHQPTDESEKCANTVIELISFLLEYKAYKNYNEKLTEANKQVLKAKKAYRRLKTVRRFKNLLNVAVKREIIINEHDKTNIEELEEKLKRFESFIDKKYWDYESLIEIETSLRYGYSNSIEEAIIRLEKNK